LLQLQQVRDIGISVGVHIARIRQRAGRNGCGLNRARATDIDLEEVCQAITVRIEVVVATAAADLIDQRDT
jgi:hypothetical protein